MSERVDVALGERGYPITIGPGVLTSPVTWRDLPAARRVLVVHDSGIPADYHRQVLAALSERQVDSFQIVAGERSKNLDSYAGVMQALAGMNAGRDALIVALGGGVVGDLAGFAAATWMRGIGFVQVPTTLLAMVDSSVGGKTGINLPQGKNLVGAFQQPLAVVADTSTLATLPDRELRAGLAEVVKYGAIGDAGFFAWLEDHVEALLARDPVALTHAIATSVRHKAAIVARDERESGERALLNFGHTFGHALESATGYGTWLHGEAVAIGMVQAARLSTLLGMAPAADAERLARLLTRFGLPVATSTNDDMTAPAALLALMRLDKKATAAGLRFVLWHGIGQAVLVDGVADADVLQALAAETTAAA